MALPYDKSSRLTPRSASNESSSSFSESQQGAQAPPSERSPDSSNLREMVQAIKGLNVDEAPVLSRVGSYIREFFRMDVFVAFNVLPGPRHHCLDFLQAVGLSPQSEQALAQLLRSDPSGWGPFSIHLADESQRNRVICAGPLATQTRSGPGEALLHSLGLDRHWQLRVWVCDGPNLLAWIGGFRLSPFTGREQFLMSALVPALIPRLRWERQFSSAQVMMAGLTTALEALPYAAFIVRDSEGILFANEAGQQLLREHAGSLELLRSSDDGVNAATGFDLKPLNTPGFGDYFLVTQSQLNTSARMEALRAEWDLTQRQREVLGLLVQGDSNRAIATKLGCALRTAELHVSNVIRKAGVQSRTELTARFWSS